MKSMTAKMTQEQRLDYLIKAFKEESPQYKNLETLNELAEKRRLLRSLMNVRMPKTLDEKVISVQNAYLQERIRESGIVWPSDIPVNRDGLSIWQGDITRLAADAIVNAANSQMLGCFVPCHNCIDNCIHTYAGVQLRAECARQMNDLRIRYGKGYEQPTALPMLTEAYNLPAKKIVHIVGPIVEGRLTAEHERLLAECYRSTLALCAENGLRTVAFCAISTGAFHFPKKRAAEIAVDSAERWLRENAGQIDQIIFTVFSDESRNIYEQILR